MATGKVEFFQLRCFVAVAKELNFRRAAERMNMTQPPLSRQIKLLEHGVGTQLLNRSSRQVSLTEAGHSFLRSATDILQRVEQAVHVARQAESGTVGAISMGFVPSAAIDFVPRIVAAVGETLPGVTFTPIEMMSYEIIEALASGQIDLGLTRTLGTRGELSGIRVVREPYILAMPANHPLARKDAPDLRDLDGLPFIAYSSERGGYVREVQNTLFASEGIAPRIMLEVSQTHAILPLVNRGIGLALVPRSARAIRMDNLVYCDIDLPERFRSELFLMSGLRRDAPLYVRMRDLIVAALGPPPRQIRAARKAASANGAPGRFAP